MKRTTLAFCALMLAIGACTPATPAQVTQTPIPNSTLSATGTLTGTPTPTPTGSLPDTSVPSPTNTSTSTPTSTVEPQISDTPSPTPTPTLACETDTAFAFISVSTESIKVGEVVKVTVTVNNEGCVALGIPQYRLYIQPDGSQPVFSPEQPEPVVHYLAVGPGESDSQEFELVAIASGQATLTGSVSYEVHLGYPGPAYWGYRQTEPLAIAVGP